MWEFINENETADQRSFNHVSVKDSIPAHHIRVMQPVSQTLFKEMRHSLFRADTIIKVIGFFSPCNIMSNQPGSCSDAVTLQNVTKRLWHLNITLISLLSYHRWIAIKIQPLQRHSVYWSYIALPKQYTLSRSCDLHKFIEMCYLAWTSSAYLIWL